MLILLGMLIGLVVSIISILIENSIKDYRTAKYFSYASVFITIALWCVTPSNDTLNVLKVFMVLNTLDIYELRGTLKK